MTQKAKKTINIIVDVIVGIILVLVLFVTICVIASGNKGYVKMFGNATMVVRSDSMEGDYSSGWQDSHSDWKNDNNGGNIVAGFNTGDIISVKILTDAQKKTLQVGDIVTFKFTYQNQEYLNTHRIISVSADGTIFGTKGDNAIGADSTITASDIIGQYTGSKISGLGNYFLFLQKPVGYIVCVVLPTVLVLGYCVYLVIASVRERGKLKLAAERESMKADLEAEKEKIRAELLAQMKAENATDNVEAVKPDNTESEEKK